MSATEQVKKTKRAPRRNFQRDLERVTAYVQAAVRIFSEPTAAPVPDIAARLAAYKDVLAVIQEK